jgi:hypothetical protein
MQRARIAGAALVVELLASAGYPLSPALASP